LGPDVLTITFRSFDLQVDLAAQEPCVRFRGVALSVGDIPAASPRRDVEASAEELWDLIFNGIGAPAT
jgi:hypothetical protein